MRASKSAYVMACIVILTAAADAQTVMRLDVGNDTDYDMDYSTGATWPQRVDLASSVNHYVRSGCWCVGCISEYPATHTGNCTVPVIMKSDWPGNLTVDEINITLEVSKVINETAYGKSFRYSEGGCWQIAHMGGTTPILPIPAAYSAGVCGAPNYDYLSGFAMPQTDDAIDDAVYRLLNGTLDEDGNGIIDITYDQDHMAFEAEGKIGVQNMWGPLKMRLIVWA
jgi:hypothetical protein